MASGGLLSLPNLILAGDLNLTLNASDIWGSKALPDPLGPFFSKLFSDHHLVDVASPCAGPTWRNGRIGEYGISKRLDRFFYWIILSDVGFLIISLWFLNGMIFIVIMPIPLNLTILG